MCGMLESSSVAQQDMDSLEKWADRPEKGQ